jgi:sulfite exporter TauE/SafE
MDSFYYVALVTGLVTSLHCIGMCGPIAVALPLGKKSWPHRLAGSLTYNLGRTITYAILGAIFGLVGQGIHMAGFHQWASIIIGILMILSVVFPALLKDKRKVEQFLFGYTGKLIGKFRKLFAISSFPSLFLIGLLNGLLPCGPVYVAIAGALNTGEMVSGIIYMIIFGIGTIPIMLAIPMLGNIIGTKVRKKFSWIVSVFIVLLGILFILRGLSLGIMYISPKEKMLKPHVIKKHQNCCTGEVDSLKADTLQLK